MRWFVGLHPRYFRRAEDLLSDFAGSGTDILYTHIDFLRSGVNYQMRDKILVFFIENPPNFFGAGYFDNKEYFPQGPWSTELASVNWDMLK